MYLTYNQSAYRNQVFCPWYFWRVACWSTFDFKYHFSRIYLFFSLHLSNFFFKESNWENLGSKLGKIYYFALGMGPNIDPKSGRLRALLQIGNQPIANQTLPFCSTLSQAFFVTKCSLVKTIQELLCDLSATQLPTGHHYTCSKYIDTWLLEEKGSYNYRPITVQCKNLFQAKLMTGWDPEQLKLLTESSNWDHWLVSDLLQTGLWPNAKPGGYLV